jgi:2Fe-2S ferredoxin
MPKVTFLPMNVTVDAAPGESILDVAINHDIPIMHACGGFCACTTCHVVVKSGGENLSPIDDDEADRLEYADGNPTDRSRLGCQAKLPKTDTEVVVEIVNVDL